MEVTSSVTKEEDVSKQLSTSQARRILQTNFFIHTSVGYKQSISTPENARTNNPAAILEGFRKNPPRTGISWIIAAQNMVPHINSGRFEDFADTISDEYR